MHRRKQGLRETYRKRPRRLPLIRPPVGPLVLRLGLVVRLPELAAEPAEPAGLVGQPAVEPVELVAELVVLVAELVERLAELRHFEVVGWPLVEPVELAVEPVELVAELAGPVAELAGLVAEPAGPVAGPAGPAVVLVQRLGRNLGRLLALARRNFQLLPQFH